MIKIVCTSEEKRLLKLSMSSPPTDCPFDFCESDKCIRENSCADCVEHNIEWEVIDDGCKKG